MRGAARPEAQVVPFDEIAWSRQAVETRLLEQIGKGLVTLHSALR